MSLCGTNTFPRDKPWGKRISQLNTLGLCCRGFFPQCNPSCSFQFLGIPAGPPEYWGMLTLAPPGFPSLSPPAPTHHATNSACSETAGHLSVQLGSIALQSFLLLGQLRGSGWRKPQCYLAPSPGGQLPALLPSHHRIPDVVWASGNPQPAGSHAPSPSLVRVSFCAEQMGTSCLGTTSLPSPRCRGKMHHQRGEQSPPGCGTAPLSEGQVKV